MGDLVWHQWGRLLALSAAAYMVWGSFWAFLYEKFFWDMIPGPNTEPFVFIVVTIPLLQIFNLIIGLMTIALEMPLPWIRGTSLHRSLILRVVMYFIGGFIGIMVYQTVDCAVYYVITSAVYGKAIINGEMIPDERMKDDSKA